MKILELNFWNDSNEKYLNFGAKYRKYINKLDFGIFWLKCGQSFVWKNNKIFVVFVEAR
jgi:hypothetical protein